MTKWDSGRHERPESNPKMDNYGPISRGNLKAILCHCHLSQQGNLLCQQESKQHIDILE